MPSTDIIRLTGLGGVGRHGVLPEERRTGQLFKVDVAMQLDTRAAAASDDLAASVDYAAVAGQVVELIEGEPVNLIETLAARIADAVLSHDAVQRVEVTVHKPEAPVGVPFGDVEVSIVRDTVGSAGARLPAAAPAAALPAVVEPLHDEGVPPLAAAAAADAVGSAGPHEEADIDAEPELPVDVVLGLGGNVGDVRATLRAAIDDLAASGDLEIVGVAPLAKTAAVLQPDAVAQPDFLNTVVVARTSLSPRAVLALTSEIENAHGRVRGGRWGERTLDIDIIAYGSVATADPELSLPHPRANERAFVLVPWAHLDPDAFLPGLGGGPVAALADTAPDRDGVRWLALDWYLPHTGGRRAEPEAAAAAPEQEDLATSRVHTEHAAAAAPAQEPAPPPQPEPEPEPDPEPAPVVPAAFGPPAPQPEPDRPAAPAAPPAPAAPWEEQGPQSTRIRPRWEPLRRDDGE